MLKGLGPRPPAATLLGAQAVAHGLLCILTIVPAAGLFLSSYGAARLPYVYIAVALVGMGSAPLVARSLSRRPIVAVARPILLGIAFLHLGCWVVIERWHAAWPAVIVQLLLPMTLQIGFVFLGSQAGRLLTVREMKAWFSLIATGFSVALLFGGIVAPLLVDLLGRTHHLLVLTAMSAGLMLWLISITYRRYPDQLAMTPIDPQRSFPDAPTPDGAPVRQLIVLIFAYQIFSSLGTQFGEFFLFDRAAARYASSEELARFAAHYNVGLNLVEILVLGVVAGPLLARFGLRFGLFANPSVLLVGFVAAAVVAPIAGVGSFAMLLAATAARTGDITLTNSTTRTATNTAYQALPYAVRPSVQARTEGVAVPAAIGLSGVILLAIDQFGGAVEALIAVSIVTCVGWLLATTLLYSRYRGQLHENLAHRVLTPRMVPFGDAGTDALIELVLHDAVVDQGDATRPPTSHFSGSDPRTLSRQIRSTPDDLRLVDALVDVVRHGPRQVRALTLRRLSGLLEKGDPRRGELAAGALEASVLDVAEIVGALVSLPESDAVEPLRAALSDEVRAAQDCVLASLMMILDPDAVARAQQWLRGDERTRATALEAIEVNTPAPHGRAVLAVLEVGTDAHAAARRLLAIDVRLPVVADWLTDLRDDPRGVWREPWLSVCASDALSRTATP